MTYQKYFPGDTIGPLNIIFLRRSETDSKKGCFICPFCDEQFYAYICNVKRGKTKSCGCNTKNMIRQKLQKDITGERFGHLVALYNTNQKQNNHSVWHCRCDCGQEIDIPISNLTTGNTTTCGRTKECSYAKKKASQSALDLTGKCFGKLTVNKELYRKNEKVYWDCTCDCGTRHIIKTTKSLQQSSFASCGCEHSRGEAEIAQWLDNYNIIYNREVAIPGCINPQTNGILRFDFYIPKIHCYIEYNGEQHYYYSGKGWNNKEHFENTIFRDKIKKDFCQQHNIRLEYITYQDNINSRMYNIINKYV